MRGMRLLFPILLCLGVAMTPTDARPSDAQKNAIRSVLLENQYVARVDLFRVRVDESGIVENPYDGDAIKARSPINVAAMQIRGDMVRIVLRHPQELGKTAVVFRFGDDLGEDHDRDVAALEKMIGYVFLPTNSVAKTLFTPDELLQELQDLLRGGFESETLAEYAARQRLTIALSKDDMTKWQAAGIPEAAIRAALSCEIVDGADSNLNR